MARARKRRVRIRRATKRLTVLPVEILSAIALLLPVSAQASLICTCKFIFAIISKVLYKKVDVVGRGVRLLCITLISRKIWYCPYVELIQTFVFTGNGLDDLHLTYPMFTDALLEMIRLKSLTLSIPQAHAVTLMSHLRLKGLLRTSSFRSVFQCLSHMATFPDRAQCSPLNLPSLRYLCVYGDCKLIALASFRRITEICIGLPVSITSFAQIMDSLTGGQAAIPLQHFTLTLTSRKSIELIALLFSLGSCCNDLLSLVIEIPSGCFNALSVSRIISSNPLMFPKLERLAINLKGTRPPFFITPRIVSLAVQRQHIEASGRTRTRLQKVRLGPIEWSKVDVGYSFEWSVEDHTGDNVDPVDNLPVALLLDCIGCFFERSSDSELLAEPEI